MRFTTRAATALGAAMTLAITLIGADARAAGGVTGKGETGQKGGTGPTAAPTTGGGAFDESVSPDTTTRSRKAAGNGQSIEATKPWELGASWETHRLIRQEDVYPSSSSKLVNVLAFYARYDLDERDQLRISDYFDQHFIADEGETGLRSGNATLSYTRLVPLPRDFTLAASASLGAPTSFQAQKASMIVAPGLALQLDKKLGRWFNVGARVAGSLYIDKYREAEGGAANGKYFVGGTLTAEAIMPFHDPLSIGADASTGYTWFYDVASGDPSVVQNGVEQDPYFPSGQPMLQSYSMEIFARYLLPNMAGMKSDVTLALADGDPTLGSVSVLHGGVSYFYAFYRYTSTVYVAMNVRY